MPAPIRIAQVVEAVEGGCKKHVLDLVCGLDSERFEQTVVFSPHRDPGFDETIHELTEGRVETVRCDFRRSMRPWSDWAAYRFLKELFRERNFDIIHCHSAKAGFLGRLAARGLGVAKLYTPHCFAFEMDDSLWSVPFIWLERYVGPHTDRLIAVSPSEAEIARTFNVAPPESIITIENAIDPARLDIDVDQAEKKAELGIEACKRVVLSVGALRPQKGYEYLLRAVPAVLENRPEAIFLVAGEGQLRGRLERLVRKLGIEEAVRLLGARSDVPELLKIADCFAMPSRWEAGPYALLEAMAAGTPVVGADIAGIRDWIRPGETGRLASNRFFDERRNAAEFATAVSDALADEAGSRRMAEAARRRVLERNTLERWLEEMAVLYEEVVQC